MANQATKPATPPPQRTPRGTSSTQRQLLNLALNGDLDNIVTAHRTTGQSWRGIAADLHQRTGIYVSHEAVRAWYRRRPAGAAR